METTNVKFLTSSLRYVAWRFANFSLYQTKELEKKIKVNLPFSAVDLKQWLKAAKEGRDKRFLSQKNNLRKCPCCGSNKSQFIFYSFDNYPYNECLECGTWFITQIINFSFFLKKKCATKLASKNFEKRKSEENFLNDQNRFENLFKKLVKTLDESTSSINYLDVGCGTGNSLLTASKIGFRATGLEADPLCLEFCRSRHLSVVNRWKDLVGQTFDLISFWETLEHLANPLAVLRACHKKLSTSGVLALTIPNLDCPMVKTFRQGCPWVSGGMDSPGHLNLFGRKQLEKLLQRAGFSLLFLDGIYGSAVFELCAYFQGKYRGVQEIIAKGGEVEISFPCSLYEALNNIGPSFTNLERSFLLSPILFALACRAGEEEKLHAGIQKVTQEREREIRETAGEMEPLLWAALQEEPFFRNQLKTLGDAQVKTTQLFVATQAELNKRDEMLKLQESERIRLVKMTEAKEDEKQSLNQLLQEKEKNLKSLLLKINKLQDEAQALHKKTESERKEKNRLLEFLEQSAAEIQNLRTAMEKIQSDLQRKEKKLEEEHVHVNNLRALREYLTEVGISGGEDALRTAKTTLQFLKSIRLVLMVANPVVFFAADKLIRQISAVIREFEERAQSRIRDIYAEKERTP